MRCWIMRFPLLMILLGLAIAEPALTANGFVGLDNQGLKGCFAKTSKNPAGFLSFAAMDG